MSEEEYPEHAKMMAVKEESQAIGAFLDTCGYVLCEADPKHRPGEEGPFWPVAQGINQILARYFGIDLDELEREKRRMLAKLQRM